MIEDNIENKVEFIREAMGVEYIVDYMLARSEVNKCSDIIDGAVRVAYTNYILSRNLREDYVFKHPKDLKNLLLYFLLSWSDVLINKYVKFSRYEIKLKEVCLDLSLVKGASHVFLERNFH